MPIARNILRPMLLAALLATSYQASADVNSYFDRTPFNALGTITQDYGFDDLDTSLAATGDGFLFVGDPYTTHGVTYNSGPPYPANLVVGPSAGLGLTSNVLTSNVVNGSGQSYVSGLINGNTTDLFGFDLGTLLGASPVDISLTTNVATYSFVEVAVPQNPTNSFFGFAASSGEYFTGFTVTADTSGVVPTLDNVTLGVEAIPEPEVLSLLLPGLLLVGLGSRRSVTRRN